MTNKEMILFLFYNQHLKQNEIAKRTGATKQYVSKIVKQDSRNIEEKESRKQSNKEKRKEYLKQYFSSYKSKKDNSYEQMLAQHRKDILELSYDRNFK